MINKQILEQNIITALNLQALNDDKKIALIDKMAEVAQKRLTLRVIDQMSENDQAEFKKILDSSPDKVSDFLQKTFPNFLEMVQEEVVKLKEELIGRFTQPVPSSL